MVERGPRPEIASVLALSREIFGSRWPLDVEPATRGISTYVYRVRRRDEAFYLRILPEVGDSFEPEAAVHERLRDSGVRVPAVLHVDPRHPDIGLSVMVTSALPGQPLDQVGVDGTTPAVLHRVGRDLASINALPVDSFGWITRDIGIGDRLAGDLPSWREFNRTALDESVEAMHALLSPDERDHVATVLPRHAHWLDTEHGSLAHGDFEASHIFVDDGRYAGIIDFGEMRGTDRWYDLGHLRLHEHEKLVAPLLPPLLVGYRSVTPLPADAVDRIAFASLLIGLRSLARERARGRPGDFFLSAVRRDVAALVSL